MSPASRPRDEFPPAVVSIEYDRKLWTRTIGPRGEYTVGRGSACDVVLKDPAVSRRHAVLFAHAGCLRVVALPDARPVFVNGAAVTDRFLAEQDIVRLGDTTLYVNYPPLGGDPTTDPKGGPGRAARRAASQPMTVKRAVVCLRERHGEHFDRLHRKGLDAELGELLGLSASRARRRLDALAAELDLDVPDRGTSRYVAVAEAFDGDRSS